MYKSPILVYFPSGGIGGILSIPGFGTEAAISLTPLSAEGFGVFGIFGAFSSGTRNLIAIRRLGHRLENLGNDRIDINPFGIGIEIGEYTVSEYRKGHCPDVFRCHCKSAVKDRSGFCRENHVLSGPRAGPPSKPIFDELGRIFLVRPSCPDQIDRIVDHVLSGWNLADELLDQNNIAALKYRLNIVLDRLSGGHHDIALFLPCRVVDIDRKHETVELGFGERISSFLLDRVWVAMTKNGCSRP